MLAEVRRYHNVGLQIVSQPSTVMIYRFLASSSVSFVHYLALLYLNVDPFNKSCRFIIINMII